MKITTKGITSEFINPMIYYGTPSMDLADRRVENADSLIIDSGDSYIRIPLKQKYHKRGRVIKLGDVDIYTRDKDLLSRVTKLIVDWVVHNN